MGVVSQGLGNNAAERPAEPDLVQVMQEISTSLSAMRSPEQGLTALADRLRELFHVDLAVIAPAGGERHELRWSIASGSRTGNLQYLRLHPGQGWAGRIAATGRPLRCARFPDDLTPYPESYPIFAREGLQAALGVAMMAGERVAGVITLGQRSQREFTDNEQNLLQGIANMVGSALHQHRMLERNSVTAVVGERVQLAHELQDGLAQNMAMLTQLLSGVERRLAGHSVPADILSDLQRGRKLLDECYQDLRQNILDLERTEDALGDFAGTLAEYLYMYSRETGIQGELVLPDLPPLELTPGQRLQLMRIVQEALSNVRRHSGATRVWVRVYQEKKTGLRMAIQDNGAGFDTDVITPESSMGLRIMLERAQSIGARLDILSTPGAGTHIAVRLPA